MRGNRHRFGYFEDAPAWNMGEPVLLRLNNLMMESNTARANGNFGGWFNNLCAITSSIFCWLNEDEKKATKETEQKLRAAIIVAMKNKSDAFMFDLMDQLSDYEKFLVLSMYKYEIYYPKYEHKNWQEAAKEEDV